MKTYSAKAADIKREWHLVDATDQTLGRMSTQIARLLMGKHKPMFTPSQDTGDYVVVINAGKIRFTGDKARQKLYHRHSGYPGGFKSVTLEKMMQTDPSRVIKHSVNGMLPHTRQGAMMKKRLRVFNDDKHPHAAQLQASQEKETK
ncbi:MAG: 50S ribosomal protein L13 [Dehalococcoidia bacterium]|jgi:large subunit ribosomal protein L13